MPPKTAVGADEDVKFLLTVIKQMAGTVSIPLIHQIPYHGRAR